MSDLGLKETVAMGVGGVVGGGIFAVLGVAAEVAGNAAFLIYAITGLIALASGYSYVKLTEHFEDDGGSFTFLEHYVDNRNIAGVVGWVLIVGYIGTMAMYAYAFGSFAGNLFGVDHATLLRGTLSVGIIALFVAINLLGVGKTGSSEDLLVYAKVAILLFFGAIGLYSIMTRPELHFFSDGLFNHGYIRPVMAIGAIFVSFEGWQLLTYEFSDIKGGTETLKKGVLWTIVISTAIYVLVALVTTSLASPETIIQHRETVLAFVAGKIFSNPVLQRAAAGLISIAALFSTASAINATLFGTARLSHRIATEKDLPQVFSFQNREGIPTKSLLIIGAFTASFTLLGSLEEITTFASISFIGVFSVVNYVCLRDPDVNRVRWIPWTGLVGTLSALGLLIYHLYRRQPHVLVFVTGLFAALFLLEFLYLEREELEELEEEVEDEVEEEMERIEEDLDG